MIHRVCVFCGSNVGTNPAFRESALELARILVARQWELVYGGGAVGLMGILADAVLARGGEVTGVIPEFLVDKEVGHSGLTRRIVVPTMHERKETMYRLSDAIVAMPGGFGTLDELFEFVTWAQLGLHGKPIGLLNVDGFYDSLLSQLDRMVTDGFLRAEHRGLIRVGAAAETLVRELETHSVRPAEKWNIRP